MAANPLLDGIKIQAHVIIPVVKALEAELGKEKAHALVGNAIAESWAEIVASRNPGPHAHPADERGALDYPPVGEITDHTDTAYGVNVTECAFADYFRKIGEPEIGALLTCGRDPAVERKLRPDWEFQRTRTRMEGAPICDFRWQRKT